MDPRVLLLFEREVAHQCQFALMAIKDVQNALAAPDAEPPTLPTMPDLVDLNHEQRQDAQGAWMQAIETYKLSVRRMPYAPTSSVGRVFASLQAFLAAAANVSKLLWPLQDDTRHFPDRQQELHASLEIVLPSPLESRILRNHFEHFDARLDAFFDKNPGGNFADMNIGPPMSIDLGAPHGWMYRNFDPTTGVVWFQGTEFTLGPMVQALRGIGDTASLRAIRWPP
jgi:hypothetical protein